jgi:hypothetical protein
LYLPEKVGATQASKSDEFSESCGIFCPKSCGISCPKVDFSVFEYE